MKTFVVALAVLLASCVLGQEAGLSPKTVVSEWCRYRG
jgi:hypothetical protein